MKLQLPLILLLLVAVSACGGKDDDTATLKAPDSPEKLYADGRAEMDSGDYKEAVKAFEEVERQHPYSSLAIDAQVMSAYSSYLSDDYETALVTLERFVKLYPSSESSPYAYYLIALCYYDQISDVGRDQKMTEEAMQALREVVRRFPNSEYARDAKIKLDLTVDHLAGKEMQVGRYYQKREDYIAAVNRFRYVVENFQTTSHVPEALHRLVECYLKLGVADEAQRYAAVLGHNFPNSTWYRDSYKLMMGKAKLPTPGSGAVTPASAEGQGSSWLDHVTPW
jgi:outer membrane protein assembly factor BamD